MQSPVRGKSSPRRFHPLAPGRSLSNRQAYSLLDHLRAVLRLHRQLQTKVVPRRGLQTVVRRCRHLQWGSWAPTRLRGQARPVAASHWRPRNVPSVPRHLAPLFQLLQARTGTPLPAKGLAATQALALCPNRHKSLSSRAASKRGCPRCCLLQHLWRRCRVLCRLRLARPCLGEL